MTGLLYTWGMGRSSAKGRQNAVRRARLVSELTQAQLAEQVGVSRQTIVAIENGGYAPSVYLALALSQVLGACVEDLFGEQVEAGTRSAGVHA